MCSNVVGVMIDKKKTCETRGQHEFVPGMGGYSQESGVYDRFHESESKISHSFGFKTVTTLGAHSKQLLSEMTTTASVLNLSSSTRGVDGLPIAKQTETSRTTAVFRSTSEQSQNIYAYCYFEKLRTRSLHHPGERLTPMVAALQELTKKKHGESRGGGTRAGATNSARVSGCSSRS